MLYQPTNKMENLDLTANPVLKAMMCSVNQGYIAGGRCKSNLLQLGIG